MPLFPRHLHAWITRRIIAPTKIAALRAVDELASAHLAAQRDAAMISLEEHAELARHSQLKLDESHRRHIVGMHDVARRMEVARNSHQVRLDELQERHIIGMHDLVRRIEHKRPRA